MLDWLWGVFSHDIAIDLGTANTLVAVRSKGIVVREPSMVARHKKSKQLLAVGFEAKKMWGKTPGTLEVVKPLQGGVIADFDAAEAMLTKWIRFVHQPERARPQIPRPRVIIGIPSGITEVERRAVQEAALRAGARKAWLIEESMAAALGSGAAVDEPIGIFVVDIGGGTMEIAVISMAGTVVAKSLRLAGDAMDEAVVTYFRHKHALLIGQATAEKIKIELGSAGVTEEQKSASSSRSKLTTGQREAEGQEIRKLGDEKIKKSSKSKDGKQGTAETKKDGNTETRKGGVTVIRGRDLRSGLPRSLKVTSEDIEEALKPVVEQMVAEVQDMVDEIPPELMVDILERGIILTGGGALIRGLDRLMAKETNLPVNVAEDPLTCVVRGCMGLYEDPRLLEKVRVTGGLR